MQIEIIRGNYVTIEKIDRLNAARFADFADN